jgi:hypothetical protein
MPLHTEEKQTPRSVSLGAAIISGSSSPSRAEGRSRLTHEPERLGESVQLTVIPERENPGSKLIEAVWKGWPLILSSLKSLLETGEALVETRQWPLGT